jgi:hypothetical protein
LVDQTKDQESAEVSVGVISPEPPKTRKSWSQLKRDLTDEELASSAAVKMLLDEVDRLDLENVELTGYRDRFHEADKTCAVLREQQKGNRAADIVFGAGISLGGVMLGLSQSAPNGTISWEFIALGMLTVAAGIAAKVIRR